ncbi:MAG TPA: ABC transporter permease [Candidatus Ventricola intestinavium]|nr:ABC transporter permease [Candidatus Ventricola intestinavium]
MLLRCIRAENRKLRGCAIWPVFLIVPMISAGYGTFNYLQNLGLLQSEWYSLFTQHTLFYSMFFFAPLVGIYAAYLWRLEHTGHNWNRIMAAPVPPILLYLAKLAVVLKMALLTQLWVCVLYVACGKLWAGLPGFPPLEILLWIMRGALGSVAIIALQLLLSMVIRSFAVPVLIALAGGVAGMMAVNWDLGLFWPYALMLLGMNSNKSEDALAGGIAGFLLSTAVFTALFVAVAWILLKKRDVKA